MECNRIYKIKTLKLLKRMMQDNDFSYDIYFRMAVVEEYLKGNEQIWDLYNYMQQKRIAMVKHIPRHMIDHKNEFITLIESIRKNGFIDSYPLLVNNQYLVIDGAHRMACNLYFKIKDITITTTKEYIDFIPNEYTKHWFEQNGLNECILYAEKQKKKVNEMINNV